MSFLPLPDYVRNINDGLYDFQPKLIKMDNSTNSELGFNPIETFKFLSPRGKIEKFTDDKNVDFEGEDETKVCELVWQHFSQCQDCQDRMGWSPMKSNIMRNWNLKNDLFDLVAYIFLGIVLILLIRQ